jgi:hypothetical protein
MPKRVNRFVPMLPLIGDPLSWRSIVQVTREIQRGISYWAKIDCQRLFTKRFTTEGRKNRS